MLRQIRSTIPAVLPPTMTLDDAAGFLGISRSTAYALAAVYGDTRGVEGLPNVRFGARVLVLTAPLLELVQVVPGVGLDLHLEAGVDSAPISDGPSSTSTSTSTERG